VQRTKPSSLRAFLALDLDDEALDVLSAHLRRLRAMPWANAVRWVSVDNLHLTLRFLGDIAPAQAERYIGALRQGLTQVADLPGLSLRVSGPRLFPRPSHPRVIACLAESNATLTALADLAEACATGIGLAAEKRPFNGHITLGRCAILCRKAPSCRRRKKGRSCAPPRLPSIKANSVRAERFIRRCTLSPSALSFDRYGG